ncbi:MAG: phage/plasmid primase, P4 family [Polyangiaceae bacterium]
MTKRAEVPAPRDGDLVTAPASTLEERLVQAASEGVEANFARWLRFVGVEAGEWIELQALKIPSRYGRKNRFAHADSVTAALPLLRQGDRFGAQGVFVIANRLNPAVATRSAPRTWHDAEKGASTTDRDVTHRRVLFIDVDALRATGTSATAGEMACATAVATAVFARLADLLGSDRALGYGHSGNGRQVFIAIEPAAEPSALTPLTKGILAALSITFAAPGAEIDRTVADAKRLVPAFGTTKKKGAPDVQDRPHRRTAFVCADEVGRVRAVDLEHVFDQLREPLIPEHRRQVDAAMGRKTSDSWRAAIKGKKPSGGAGPFERANAIAVEEIARALELFDGESVRCPGCSNTDGVALVNNGLKCHHKTCADRGVPGTPGFRTPVDLVVEVRQHAPVDAARWILERFASDTSAERQGDRADDDDTDRGAPVPALGTTLPVGLAGRSFSLTDTGNAERFVAHHGEDVRYCHEWKKWLIWAWARWAADRRGEIELRASQTVAAVMSEAVAAKAKEGRALRAHATASESVSSLSAMVKIARSRPGIAVVPDDFDRDPSLFNCNNGTLDLRAGVLLPHDRRALITKLAPVDYDPKAECPRWLTFIGDVMGGNDELVAFLQRAVGYSLTGSVKEQVLFFLHGAGANGKSTFLRTLLELFGDYGLQAAPDLLIARNADAHPTAIADLFGRRLAVCQEIEGGRSFAEATVKQLTGEDVIRARRMREDFWSFAPTHKLWLAANHKPNVHGTDHAIWRRIRLIPFTVTIPEERRDSDLLEKLRMERSGILRWAVDGYRKWSQGGLRAPKDVVDATAEYREEQDLFHQFLDERCEIEPLGSLSSAELYRAYQIWCEQNGCRPLAQRGVGNELRGRGFRAFKGPRGGERRWRGLQLRSTPSPTDQTGDFNATAERASFEEDL